jgi:tripartite-type tricarboxylate transporter receptor subunit TctC
MTAVLSGETQLTFTSVYTAWTQARNGRAKALAVTGKSRSPAAPQVPTMAEAGLPNYVAGNWYGLLAPAGTPRSIVDLLNARVNGALQRPDTKDRLIAQGFEPSGGSPAEFGAFIRSEIKEFAALVKSAGLMVQ